MWDHFGMGYVGEGYVDFGVVRDMSVRDKLGYLLFFLSL